MEKNKAIILKTYLPQKYKVCLLDVRLGKILAVPNRDDIGYGSLLLYVARQTSGNNNLYFMHTIDLIDMPLQIAIDDILFLHHVLEMCYFFVPLGEYVDGLFDLIILLYTSDNLLQNATLKKIFLFQLFARLGLYPEEQKFQHPYFHYLATTSIDIIAQCPINLMIEAELEVWLLQCIEVHPLASSFKTVNFLHDNRIV